MTVKVSLAYKESDLTTAVDALVDRCEKLLRRLVDMGVTGDVLSMHTASLVHAAEDLLGSGEGGSIQCARTLLTKADQWSADEGCWSTGPSHAHTRSMLRGQLFLCRGVADAIDHAPPEGADLLSTAKNHLHQALSLTKGLKTEACLTTMIRASVALAWVHVRLSCSASAVIHAENARDACMAGAHSGDGVRCLAARVLSAVSHETAVIAKYGEAVKQWSEAMVSASAAASVAKEFPGYGDPAVVNALPLIKEQLKLCKLRSQALFPRAQTNACAASLLGGLVPPAILLSNSHSLPLLRRSLCRLENTLSCGESPLALQFPSAASLKHTSPPPHGTRAKKRPPPPGNHRSSPAAVQHQHGTVSRKKRPASVHGRSGGGGSGGGGVRIGGGLTTSSVRRGQRGVGGSVKAGMRSPRGGGGGRLAAGGGAAEAQQHALGYCHGPAPHSQHYDSAANLPPGSPAELCALDQPPGDGSPNESSPPSPPPLPPAAAAAAASTVRPSSPATKRFSTPSHRAPVHARPSPPARFKTVIPYSPPEAAVVLALDGCDVPPPPPPPLPPSPRGRPALSSKQGSKCYKRPGASARAASTGVHLSRSDVRMRCSSPIPRVECMPEPQLALPPRGVSPVPLEKRKTRSASGQPRIRRARHFDSPQEPSVLRGSTGLVDPLRRRSAEASAAAALARKARAEPPARAGKPFVLCQTPGIGMAFDALTDTLLASPYWEKYAGLSVMQDYSGIDLLLGDKFQIEAFVENCQRLAFRKKRRGLDLSFTRVADAGHTGVLARERPLYVNYFLGSRMMTLKSKMLETLRDSMRDPYSVTPRTFILVPRSQDERYEYLNDSRPATWIAKSSHGSKGLGVKISKDKHSVLQYVDAQPKKYKWVVQQYVERPFLLQGRKFDIRTWVLMTGQRVFVYKRGVCRTSSYQYSDASLGNLDDHLTHLTNHHIQETGKRYQMYEQGNELWFHQLHECMQNLPTPKSFYKDIEPQLNHLTAIMFRAAQPHIVQSPPPIESFQLFGFDFLVDDSMRVWLLEVNGSPAIAEYLKRDMVADLAEVIMKDTDTSTYLASQRGDRPNDFVELNV